MLSLIFSTYTYYWSPFLPLTTGIAIHTQWAALCCNRWHISIQVLLPHLMEDHRVCNQALYGLNKTRLTSQLVMKCTLTWDAFVHPNPALHLPSGWLARGYPITITCSMFWVVVRNAVIYFLEDGLEKEVWPRLFCADWRRCYPSIDLLCFRMYYDWSKGSLKGCFTDTEPAFYRYKIAIVI